MRIARNRNNPAVVQATVDAFAKARTTRTLYVKEEDQLIWDKAKEVIGDGRLSTYLTSHLRTLVADQEAAAQGYKRILLSFNESGIPRKLAFYGRWLVSLSNPFEVRHCETAESAEEEWSEFWAVAITQKHNIVIFNFGQQDETGDFKWGHLNIYDSFEKANSAKTTPDGLIAAAIKALGVQVEELDI